MSENNVVYIQFKTNKNNSATDALVEAIKDAFYSQAGNVSVCEAIGCLEIAKTQVLAEIAH